MAILYLTTNEAVAEACKAFAESPFICVDTEFHRETTYYPELALIQIADDKQTVCIDPLVVTDLQPMLDLFADTRITKVLHACGQDMEIFHNEFGALPAPVFDTQVAAALIGHGEQVGYAALVKSFLDIDVDKTQTRTDWMKRPLNEKQVEYAGNDVLYLAQLYPMMLHQLEAQGRLSWLDEDFAALSENQTYIVDSDNIWRKAKGFQRLNGQQLAILQGLARWRETTAQQLNKPRRRILPDDALIDIARQKLRDSKQILALRSLNKSRLSPQHGEALADCVEQGLLLPKEQWPKLPKKHKISANGDALIDALSAVLKLQAAQHKINHACIATRKQLEALVAGERDLPLLSGWRKTHAGQACLDFIEGRSSLNTDSGKLNSKHL
ncbi:MAG: ribonuclease D [Gammaproteobacteria bacterium]|nr:ribonuclease D [Gammaproteobacteria bacterium]